MRYYQILHRQVSRPLLHREHIIYSGRLSWVADQIMIAYVKIATRTKPTNSADRSLWIPDDPTAPDTSVLDVNFQGVYNTTYLALHYFRRDLAKSGVVRLKQILYICSILAYIEAPLNLSYCGSKHAIRGMFRSLRYEMKEVGVPLLKVNLIAPTLMKTPMTKDFWSYLQDVRGFALGMPEEAVEAGMRLLSDMSIDGRAVAVVPGLGNVDLCDDFEGQDGARESLKLIQGGHLGPGPSAEGRFIV